MGRGRMSTALLARFRCAGAALLALLPRYCYVHEFRAALLLRFRCVLSARRFLYVNFEQGQNKRRDVAITTFQTQFYYDLEASAAIHGALTKISKRSGSAVQWNGGIRERRKNA